nr:Endopeptidase, NLPC/P60 domain containing protein [Ipomoea batatas]
MVYHSLQTITGIYVGDGKVIHFTRAAGHEIGTGTFLDSFVFSSSPVKPLDPPCPRCGDQSVTEGVIISCLECFLYGGELYIFQYGVSPAFFLAKVRGGTCTLARSDPVEHVLHRAEYLLQNGFGVYNLFKNNCEDFAIYCKTGLLVYTDLSVGRSGQAASVFAAVSVIASSPLRFLTTGIGGLSAVGCGVYCVSRIVSDIGVRRDVTKTPVEKLVARFSPGLPKSRDGTSDSQIPAESIATGSSVSESEAARSNSGACCDLTVERLVNRSSLPEMKAGTDVAKEL